MIHRNYLRRCWVSPGVIKKTFTPGLVAWIKVLRTMHIAPGPGLTTVMTGSGPAISPAVCYSPLLVDRVRCFRLTCQDFFAQPILLLQQRLVTGICRHFPNMAGYSGSVSAGNTSTMFPSGSRHLKNSLPFAFPGASFEMIRISYFCAFEKHSSISDTFMFLTSLILAPVLIRQCIVCFCFFFNFLTFKKLFCFFLRGFSIKNKNNFYIIFNCLRNSK